MQKSQDLIAILHRSDPRIPRRVLQSVAEPREQESKHTHAIRGVGGDDGVGDELETRGDDGNASLAESFMDHRVDQGGGGVADKRREEG